MKYTKLIIGQPEAKKKKGFILVNDKYYPPDKLPKNLKVNGDLELDGNRDITKLPEGLEVTGMLSITDTRIKEIPKGLKAGGTGLDLRNTKVTSISDNVTVKGNLLLQRSSVKSIGKNLTVGGNLLMKRTYVTEIPEGLKVGRDLEILNNERTVISSDMVVKGDVTINHLTFKITADKIIFNKLTILK